MSFDLILRGGRVIDPSQKLDAGVDVAFAGGKVAAIGTEAQGGRRQPTCATSPVSSSRPA